MVNYENNLEKREIQKRTFPLIKKRKMVSLAGPNIVNYISVVPNRVKEIEVYEKDKNVMVVQMAEITRLTRNVSYHFKDIMFAEADKKNTFYDLDFCCTIKGAERYVRKFSKCAFSLTLSLRPVSLKDTLSRFFEICDERVLLDIPTCGYNFVETNKNKYIYITYFDIWPMVSIFKFH